MGKDDLKHMQNVYVIYDNNVLLALHPQMILGKKQEEYFINLNLFLRPIYYLS